MSGLYGFESIHDTPHVADSIVLFGGSKSAGGDRRRTLIACDRDRIDILLP